MIVTFLILSNFAEVKPIIQNRCAQCHNATSMPNANWLDEAQVIKNKVKIKKRLNDRSMPPGNTTGMTDAERKRFIEWLDKQ